MEDSFETHKFVGNGRDNDKIAFKFTPLVERDNFVRCLFGRDKIVCDDDDAEGLSP